MLEMHDATVAGEGLFLSQISIRPQDDGEDPQFQAGQCQAHEDLEYHV